MMKLGQFAVALATSLFVANSSAISITGTFIPNGSVFPGTAFLAGPASTTVSGGGDLVSIFDQAASIWEPLIPDGPDLNVNYGWFNQPNSATTFTPNPYNPINPTYDASLGAGTGINMSLTNEVANPWFLDSTPGDNSEYGPETVTSADLGGGNVNVGRQFASLGGAADDQDMLSVILHELAHALAFVNFPGTPDPFTVGGWSANDGTEIDWTTVGGFHLDGLLPQFSDSLMQPFTQPSLRRLPSEVDVLAVREMRCTYAIYDSAAGIAGPACDDLTPNDVPEPAALFLVAIGFVGLGVQLGRVSKEP